MASMTPVVRNNVRTLFTGRWAIAGAGAATALNLAFGRSIKLAQMIEDSDEPVRTADDSISTTVSRKSKYPGHIPLYPHERVLLTAIAGIRSFFHPENGMNIVQLGEATAVTPFLKSLHSQMLSDRTGREILRERPNISSETLNLESLAELPKNTFGYHYWSWLQREKVSPDTRAPVKYIDDPEHAFLFQRYRQCHDFYHSICNMPVFLEGEIIVKALEAANMGVPMATLGTILAPFRLKPHQRKRLMDIYLPWAIRTGLSCKPLITVYWEKCLERDLDELRQELGFNELPPDLREMRQERARSNAQLKAKYEA